MKEQCCSECKVIFITNICSHYRVGLFETLHHKLNIVFYFFSRGDEWYWDKKNPIVTGKFLYKNLRGFTLFKNIRIVPELLKIVLFGNYDVLIKCINGRFALLMAFLGSRLRKKPFILWTELWMHPKTIFHQLTFPIVKYIYDKADAIVVGGAHCTKYLDEIGIDTKKIFIGWNVVNNSLYSLPAIPAEITKIKAELGLHNQKIVLYVGRLEEVKGLDILIQAISKLSQNMSLALIMIGSGTQERRLKKLAAELSLDNIIFHNYLPNNILYNYYSMADVFVLPSVTTEKVKETWGFVINEAMNQRCPVVATDAVGAAVGGLVENGVTGLVVPEKDIRSLSEAIARILSDPVLRAEMRNAAITKIAKWDYNFQVQGFMDAVMYTLKR